ncbi:hypothetical protein Fmac_001602 [Flemingia macrophylla]|uniref:Uncharacterized protein n=1 Tax=Flemingia macrophylla TaxID=520843 RepID=A0ABD1NHJ6_9FABA
MLQLVSVILEAKPTVLLAEKLGETGLKLPKDYANIDYSYNLNLKISLDAFVIRSDPKVMHEVFESSVNLLKVMLTTATMHAYLVVNAPTTNTIIIVENHIALLGAMAKNIA